MNRDELSERISIQVDVLQDSQRTSQLVYSCQQMSVLQRQFGRLRRRRSHPHILDELLSDTRSTSLDRTDKVLVDVARRRFVLGDDSIL